MTKPIDERALEWLYDNLKRKKINLARAESRPGVRRDELDDMRDTIDAIDWLVGVAIAALGKEV